MRTYRESLIIVLPGLFGLSQLYRHSPPDKSGSRGHVQAPRVVNYRQIEKKILDNILSPEIYDSQIRENYILL